MHLHGLLAPLVFFAGAVLTSSGVSAQTYVATDIGSLGGPTTAYDLNNLGQVVGWSFELAENYPATLSAYHQRAFVYKPGEGMVALGGQSFDGWMEQSYAVAINDQGQIAANASFSTNLSYCFSCDRGRTAWLFEPGQAERALLGDAMATGMSEDSRVFGVYEHTDLSRTSFLSGVDGQGMQLGTPILPIDLSGVGSTVSAAAAAAFSLSDLNSWAPLSGGVQFTSVRDVNDLGQILVQASDGHAYVLAPVPEPGTYALLAAGLLGVGWRLRRRNQTLDDTPRTRRLVAE